MSEQLHLRMPEQLDTTGRACQNCGTTADALAGGLCARCVLETSRKLHICRDCDREWTEASDAHCAGCHAHFSSDSAAELHFGLDHAPCEKRRENQGHNEHKVCVARSVHRDPAGIRKGDGSLKLVRVETGQGPTWSWPPMPAGAIARRRGTT